MEGSTVWANGGEISSAQQYRFTINRYTANKRNKITLINLYYNYITL